MLQVFKNNYLKKFLKSHKVLRNKQMISLEKAKTIGLIGIISDEDSYKYIFSIFLKLQNQDRNVRLMCYIDDKIVPHYCLQQLKADYFCKKNLNWFGKPDFVQMTDFLQMEFDLLIDFSEVAFPPIQYMIAQSKAKFISGALPELKEYYDLFIQMEDLADKHALLNNIQLYTKKLNGECD